MMDEMMLCFVNAPIKVKHSYRELQKNNFEVVSGNTHQDNYNYQHYYTLWDFMRVNLSKRI